MRFAGLLARRNPALQPVKDPVIEGRLFTSRATIGFMSIAAALFLLLVRFSWLQVIGYDEFATRSTSNRVRIVPVTPNRGLIYDRRGRSIAENVPAYRLELVPEKVTELKATIRRLGEIVELPEDALERFERNRTRHRDFDSVPLKFNLNNDEVARFAVNRHRFPGVEIVPYLARRYPYSDLLTHVVGYVGRLDDNDLARVDAGNYRGTTHIGKSGIERYYEDGLHGVSGLEKVETNAEGRVLRVLEREDPVHGEDLILSLDMYVQEVAWYALGNRAGAVVAVDPQDGAILAMVSKPGFDPNDFVHGISSADYRAILGSRRPGTGRYRPRKEGLVRWSVLPVGAGTAVQGLESRRTRLGGDGKRTGAVGQYLLLPVGAGPGHRSDARLSCPVRIRRQDRPGPQRRKQRHSPFA
jgi:penicillin-binding protein 2